MDIVAMAVQYLGYAAGLALSFALGWWLSHIWTSSEVQPPSAPLRQVSLEELEEALDGARTALWRLQFESDFQRMGQRGVGHE